ncbi:adenylosuccinate lyase family protein [Streptomyces sp. NPDC101160]|uniref:class-II fumarase/aspartase family protein n=1 Tax=Streptomyces sp. NPDC101160 TaxID=3366118 RepID=UPI0038182175
MSLSAQSTAVSTLLEATLEAESADSAESTEASAPTTPCSHDRGHITDSFLLGDRYATPESRAIFCDTCRIQRWLTVEAQLSLAQADLGIIPAWAAERIAEAATVEKVDPEEVKKATLESGHSLVGLLRVLERACDGEAGQYIHFGTTTQDIQDTAQSLELRDVFDELERLLDETITHVARLADQHAETLALGRTHAQPALPITFGLKAASWLDELLRHTERLREARERVLVAQLFGGAGTMAGLGEQSQELLARFAERLGLHAPLIGWHVARDRIVEYASVLAMVAGTMGRAADEIRTLSRQEFGEVSEAWSFGKVGSSTMPHKRNPERCEQVVVMARLAAAQVSTALTAMIGDHERDSRSLRLEWACVPDVAHHTLAACEIFRQIVSGLIVHEDRMRENVTAVAHQVTTEALMLTLAQRLGKQAAHHVVYEISQTAREEGVPFREVLERHPKVVSELADLDLDHVLDPAEHLGASAALTRDVTRKAADYLHGRGTGTLPPQKGTAHS